MQPMAIEIELPPHCDKCRRDHFPVKGKKKTDPCPEPFADDTITALPHDRGDEVCSEGRD